MAAISPRILPKWVYTPSSRCLLRGYLVGSGRVGARDAEQSHAGSSSRTPVCEVILLMFTKGGVLLQYQ